MTFRYSVSVQQLIFFRALICVSGYTTIHYLAMLLKETLKVATSELILAWKGRLCKASSIRKVYCV